MVGRSCRTPGPSGGLTAAAARGAALSGRADALYVVNNALGLFLLRFNEVIDQVPMPACAVTDREASMILFRIVFAVTAILLTRDAFAEPGMWIGTAPFCSGSPVSVANQIRTYWWCSPPRIGRQRMCPASSTAREIGASFSKDK